MHLQGRDLITNFVQMNLAIDIGNSFAKLAIMDRGQVVDFFRIEQIDRAYVERLLEQYPAIDAAIIISSRDRDEQVEELLEGRMKRFIRFGHGVPVPIVNRYATPETLGSDRLAAAVGANTLYPGSNILIADFGTAITIDVVTARGEYLGGNISPGAAMRFRALHQFTKHLPLRSLPEEPVGLVGATSACAIEYGIVNGIVYEMEGYIRDLSREYGDLRIIFTGGDGDFFAKQLKNTIFATYDLVAYGLNRILEYNAEL